MSYVENGVAIDIKLYKQGREYAAEYMGERDPAVKLYLTGVSIRKPLLEALLSIRDRARKLDESLLERYRTLFREGKKVPFLWGYSTIHIDSDGMLVDNYELLLAFNEYVKGDNYLYMHIYMGVAPGALTDLRLVRVVKPNREEPVRIIPEAPPTYIMKYPHKTIALIMAYDAGTLEVQTDKSRVGEGKFTEKQAVEWCKKNDNPLLETVIGTNERLAKLCNKFLKATEWDALRYITAKVNANDSAEFFTLLRHSEALSTTHPITSLRNAFTGVIAWNDKRASSRMRMVLQAWNAFRKGKEGQIAWDMTSEYPKAE